MIKDDEKRLWKAFLKKKRMSRDLIEHLNIHPNRAHYILEKWCDKGKLECGINVENGWLVENEK